MNSFKRSLKHKMDSNLFLTLLSNKVNKAKIDYLLISFPISVIFILYDVFSKDCEVLNWIWLINLISFLGLMFGF